MEEGIVEARIDRTSSIENEPRTLGGNQIQYAREAALYVMNSKSVQDAAIIFTTGLKPTPSTAAPGEKSMAGDDGKEGDRCYLGSRKRCRLCSEAVTPPF